MVQFDTSLSIASSAPSTAPSTAAPSAAPSSPDFFFFENSLDIFAYALALASLAFALYSAVLLLGSRVRTSDDIGVELKGVSWS